jgi:hypothetical protein
MCGLASDAEGGAAAGVKVSVRRRLPVPPVLRMEDSSRRRESSTSDAAKLTSVRAFDGV